MKCTNPKKSWLICFIAVLALRWAGCDTHHERVEETLERSFTVKEGGTLVMDLREGSIEVQTQAGTTLTVKALRRVQTDDPREAKEAFAAHQIQFSQSGSEVRIESSNERRGLFSFFRHDPYQVRFFVTMPPLFDLDLWTRGGSIHVGDLGGRVRARTSGGSLHFGIIHGPVRGKTFGGSITLEGCDAEADLDTSGGSITTGKVAGNLHAETSGGAIRIEGASGTIDAHTSGGSVQAAILKQPAGDCSLKTLGGSVTVYLAPDIKVTLDAKTLAGGVHSDIPITSQEEKGRSHLAGTINGGGPTLYLRTTGGGISIQKHVPRDGETI